MAQQVTGTVKTRFAPSPTGYLHVGHARTALFSFLYARQHDGTFLLRIEDTDQARHQEDAVQKIIDDLRWLGITWDEGIEVGGPNGPYRQSERLEIYRDYVKKLLDAGKAYYAFDTVEELDAMRKAAEAAKQTFRYKTPPQLPTEDDARKARQAGRPVVVRFRCPGRDVSFRDDVFGEQVTPAGEQDDFVILKQDGFPTYHLANVIDDALMGVTYIMRGQEFLGQTWRHVLLREAMGFAEPGYCHLPLILDMQGRKLSKRDGAVDMFSFRKAGYLPEALLNFVALLGWSPGEDREKMTLDEMIRLFNPQRINKANAKFDRQKLLAFNTDAIAAATQERLAAALKDFLSVNDTAIPWQDDAVVRLLVGSNPGVRTFQDVVAKCNVLFLPDEAFEYNADAVAKVLAKDGGAGFRTLRELRPVLAAADWTHDGLQKVLEGFCQSKGLGMGKVAQPIRVAVTGTTVSPAIYDTLLILGRAKTLARIDRCLRASGV
jgi:glutamyl-tRNA synthetase